MRLKQLYIWTMVTALVLASHSSLWAAFGEDIEKPKPVFTQEGTDWVTELIPRGKSTPIQIRFHVDGGMLAKPVDTDFTDANRPNINWKNYRSGYFLLDIIPESPGGEVSLTLSSNYFTSATDIWGFTERKTRTWGTIGIKTSSVKGEPTAITSVIRDGSVLDEDGMADGKIQIIIGPRDSFWGYALGTLVIRFFGVFLVLSILMIGMMLSGKIFESMDAKKKAVFPAPIPGPAPVQYEPEAVEPEPVPVEEIPADVAAAIGLGIHLYSNGGRNLRLSDDGMKAAAIGLALHLQKTSGAEV
ncbi:MAG: OadG family protein [Desulfobacula sp.]|nr:OadG family protein [Desulfobacula sp.]